jgi:hypothetical protein
MYSSPGARAALPAFSRSMLWMHLRLDQRVKPTEEERNHGLQYMMAIVCTRVLPALNTWS